MGQGREKGKVWWGWYEVEEGQRVCFRIGPLDLIVDRLSAEWRVGYVQSIDYLDDLVDVTIGVEVDELPAPMESHRFATRSDDLDLELAPVLADRAVVVRPETAFHVLSGDEAIFHMSTAVWVRLLVTETRQELLSVPTIRPSDTWFGPSTREGELCYASRTGARLNLDKLPPHPGRAITSVRVRNRASDTLQLERLALPVPALSLFADGDGHLWTNSVTVERDPDGQLAEVKLSADPPPMARARKKLQGPRQPAGRHGFVRALSSLMR